MNSASISQLVDRAIQVAQQQRRIPRATYRLQMHEGFNLRNAIEIVPYLNELGISHLYVSSLLTACAGSRHGYDIVDHSRLNPELGTEDDLQQLAKELHDRQMGLILDVVPNHMHIGPENEWWMDILESGPASKFADYFDIAWRNHPRETLHGKVLLPILDEPYGKAIRAGRLRPFFADGTFGISIDQNRLPIDPRTYLMFLEPALSSFRLDRPDDDIAVLELQSIVTAVRHLPPRNDMEPAHVTEARAEVLVIKRRLRDLVQQVPEIQGHFENAANQLAGELGSPDSFSGLIELLDAQAYRPCFWRVALDEINYRRFFDVNDLAAVAAESVEVFEAIHVKPFQWLREGIVDGLRIDHVDGLLNPAEYLERLQKYHLLSCAQLICEKQADLHTGDGDIDKPWPELRSLVLDELDQRPTVERGLYVVVEKILGTNESFPKSWTCDGTTGYEFLNDVNGLFVDIDKEEALTRVYTRFTGQADDFEDITYSGKLQILRTSMTSELSVLAHRLDRLAQADWGTRDFTLNGLRHALEEFIACFPVYRSYIVDEASPSDKIVIARAARRARLRNPQVGREVFDFIRDTLLLKSPPGGTATPEYVQQQKRFAGKFQQLTAPIMAKGVEDTALYRFNRLVSLNEVGGEPAQYGRTTDELHSTFVARAATSPFALSPLATHDTKRADDVRARINVISELPDEWERRIHEWRKLTHQFKIEVDDGQIAPDMNEEYLIYQTLIGTWSGDLAQVQADTYVKRIQAYFLKAVREAKVHSSWINPQEDYDAAISQFIASILTSSSAEDFRQSLDQFVRLIEEPGRMNSLAQVLIRCTAPGVPDIYQGTETWDDSLVDPDNRRPVDYHNLRLGQQRIKAFIGSPVGTRKEQLSQLMNCLDAKQFVTHVVLQLRVSFPELFRDGEYIPLEVTGPDSSHVFGFLRRDSHTTVLVLIPRLVAGLASRNEQNILTTLSQLTADLVLPESGLCGGWTNVFTGEVIDLPNVRIPVGTIFDKCPVGLLFLNR